MLRCGCCDRLEVVFRQAHVRLTPAEFGLLVQEAQGVPTERWEAGSFGVVRPTPRDASVEVRLLMERTELRKWQELLAGTAAMLELDDLLADTLS